MTRSRCRILFKVSNRRGLGHMMRGLNIARELRSLDPAVEILFYLRTAPSEGMWNAEFRYMIETDPNGLTHWPEVLREFAPDLVVYDTILPKNPATEPIAESALASEKYLLDDALFKGRSNVHFSERLLGVRKTHANVQCWWDASIDAAKHASTGSFN